LTEPNLSKVPPEEIPQSRTVRPFEFVEGDSFLHRLNPIGKLMMIFSVTALAITFLDPLVGLGISVAIYLIAVASKVPRQLIIIYKRVVVLMGGAFATLYFIFYTGLPYLLDGRFSVLGFVWAASGLYRLANLIGIVAVFAATTLMIELANALTLLKVPPRIASTVSLAFGSAPIFVSQLGEIVDAYQSRGFKVYHLNPLRRAAAYLALLPPTIFATLRRAQWTSVALEMKGFTYPGERTYRKASILTRVDKVVIAANVGVIGFCGYVATLRLPQFGFTQPLFDRLMESSLLHLLGGFFLVVAFVLFNIVRKL
jgi:energy-coupling factor transport system permease protein